MPNHWTTAAGCQPSPATLAYWQLIAPPLASPTHSDGEDLSLGPFVYPTAGIRTATAWLTEQVDRRMGLATLVAPRGVGATTWLRDRAESSGWENVAVQTVALSARPAGWQRVVGRLKTLAQLNAARGIATCGLIDDVDPMSHREPLRQIADDSDPNLTLVAVTHRPLATLNGPFEFPRPSETELAACVQAALRHVGPPKPLMTDGAADQLARLAGRRFDRLAERMNQLLTWSAEARLPLMNGRAVVECFGRELAASAKASRAA